MDRQSESDDEFESQRMPAKRLRSAADETGRNVVVVVESSAAMDSMTTDPVTFGGEQASDAVKVFGPAGAELSENDKRESAGQPTQMMTNYKPITCSNNLNLHQYAVKFTPDEHMVFVKTELLRKHKKFLGPYTFDGTSIFSTTKYKSDNFDLVSRRTSDNQTIIISVTYVTTILKDDEDGIQVLNLQLQNLFRNRGLKQTKINVSNSDTKIVVPKRILELWPGFETTFGLHITNKSLLHNQVYTEVMGQRSVLDFLIQCMECRGDQNDDYMTKFKNGILGTMVFTLYDKKTYRVNDVDDTLDINSKFTMNNGITLSYKDYYEQRWRCKSLFNGKQPLLVTKKTIFFDGSNEVNIIHLIPEFCVFTGISFDMRNYLRPMADTEVKTQMDPKQTTDGNSNLPICIYTNPECLESFKNCNSTLNNDFKDTFPHILPIENRGSDNAQYNGKDVAKPFSPRITPGVITRWVLISPDSVSLQLNQFVKDLRRTSMEMQLFKLTDPEIVLVKGPTLQDYVDCLEQIINKMNPSFILCVILSHIDTFYCAIKHKLCVDKAVSSQIIVAKTIRKRVYSAYTKLVVQINCKVGGAPWFVNIPIKGVIIMGYDVCLNKKTNLSYGALVATWGNTHTNYFSCAQAHKSGELLSTQLSNSVAKALDKYKSKNGELPECIIIYRNGVEDEQIPRILSVEMAFLKETFKEFYGKDPPYAFIIVRKCLDSQFLPNFPKQKNRNVLYPQSEITVNEFLDNSSMYDFRLVFPKMNTLLKMHYNVIEDCLINWSPEKMEKLTYKLTHMFYSQSGISGLPAHCQLARKLAHLTTNTLKTYPNPLLEDLLYFL